MDKISIKGLSKAKLLAGLYNKSRPLGMGFMHFTPGDMTETQAQELIDDNPEGYFDYVQGRVMKVRLEGDEFDPERYDRDNGNGAAAAVIATL